MMRVRAISANIDSSANFGENSEVRLITTPTSRPATLAPTSEPMPPTTVTTKASTSTGMPISAVTPRIGAAVAERAKELEGKGQREAALGLYEQALSLRGEPQPEWSARVAALRKSVAADYYNEGVKAFLEKRKPVYNGE